MKRAFLFALCLIVPIAVSAQLETELKSEHLLKPGAQARHISSQDLDRLNAIVAQGTHLSLPDALQAALDSARSISHATGASAAMIMPGYGLWLGTSGYSDPTLQDTITSDMLFAIASNTKTFIASAMLQLQEEGVLSLDDPLHRWLPTYRRDQYKYIDSSITIRQLLNHTSGIWNYIQPWSGFVAALQSDPNRFWSPESILTTFVRGPDFSPGADYYYSNTNYILAGMIIREATHSSVSAQLRQRFLNPLNLQRTFLAIEDSLAGVRAHPWGNLNDLSSGVRKDLYDYPLMAQYSLAWTAGALFSTPENMVRWIANLYGGQVLDASSLGEMLTFTPQSDGFYGLGILRGEVEGNDLVGHDGRYIGYDSEMMYCPAARVSIALTYNCNFDLFIYPILFSVYLHHMASHAEQITIEQAYCLPGVDTLRLQARVINPKAHPLTVKGYFRTGDSIVDSTLFRDDGLEPDSSADDGVWAATWKTPPGEAFYTVSVSTLDPIDTTCLFQDGFFTTAGPLTVDSVSYSKFLGGSYRLKPYVRNNGSSMIVRGATVALRCDDPWVKTIGQAAVSLPDLEPGATLAPTTVIGLSYDTAARPTFFNLKAEMGVEGRTYWTDSTRLMITGVAEEELLPLTYALDQNYPNPFNPNTIIRYELPRSSMVRLSLYDMLGREVSALVNDKRDAGVHEVQFDGAGLASGVYVYRLTAGDFVQSRKLMILK